MSYHYIVADAQGPAAGIKLAGMGDVQHRVILNIGTGADSDGVHIAANHRAGPN